MRSFTRRAAALVASTVTVAAASAQTLPPPSGPATPPAAKPEPRPTGVAAKVNGQEISEVAVWRALRQFPKEEHAVARKEILTHLTENALIDQYLTALKVAVEPAESEKLVTELKDELKKVGKDYAKELEAMLLTEQEFRAEVIAQMKWDKFLKDRATDAELKKMFDAAPSMFDGSMVRASHILMSPGEDKAKQAEAAQTLRAVKKMCEDESAKAVAALPATATPLEKEAARTKRVNELFSGYAGKFSTCPSKKDGGDLNFFPRVGSMVEPFAKAAFDLKVGDMSDVVATEFGYHLILCTAKNPGKQPTFEQAKEAVRAVYGMRLRDAVIGQMKPTAKIEMAGSSAVSGSTGVPMGK